ncbi:MAG: hypothetical protein QME81_11720 [bacterium]|nr:hypothetical protein [bacterium]
MNRIYLKQEVVAVLENKLAINFRVTKELNGWFVYEGKKIARVTIPKGRGDLRKGTQSSIINQLKLTNELFSRLIECPLGEEEYVQILKEKQLIPWIN